MEPTADYSTPLGPYRCPLNGRPDGDVETPQIQRKTSRLRYFLELRGPLQRRSDADGINSRRFGGTRLVVFAISVSRSRQPQRPFSSLRGRPHGLPVV